MTKIKNQAFLIYKYNIIIENLRLIPKKYYFVCSNYLYFSFVFRYDRFKRYSLMIFNVIGILNTLYIFYVNLNVINLFAFNVTGHENVMRIFCLTLF